MSGEGEIKIYVVNPPIEIYTNASFSSLTISDGLNTVNDKVIIDYTSLSAMNCEIRYNIEYTQQDSLRTSTYYSDFEIEGFIELEIGISDGLVHFDVKHTQCENDGMGVEGIQKLENATLEITYIEYNLEDYTVSFNYRWEEDLASWEADFDGR